jgi:hypothetical protein
VLLIGHGHSAANAIGWLDAVARTHPGTTLTWAVKAANKRPCVEVAEDPLEERRRIVAEANALAEDPPPFLTVERRALVESIDEGPDGFRVRLSGGRAASFDLVVALTGYRPELSPLAELELDLSPVSEGAGGIARALSNVTNCLCAPALAAADLASGEPGFHLIGAKSYGRMSTFLLENGIAQVETILDGLTATTSTGDPSASR